MSILGFMLSFRTPVEFLQWLNESVIIEACPDVGYKFQLQHYADQQTHLCWRVEVDKILEGPCATLFPEGWELEILQKQSLAEGTRILVFPGCCGNFGIKDSYKDLIIRPFPTSVIWRFVEMPDLNSEAYDFPHLIAETLVREGILGVE